MAASGFFHWEGKEQKRILQNMLKQPMLSFLTVAVISGKNLTFSFHSFIFHTFDTFA